MNDCEIPSDFVHYIYVFVANRRGSTDWFI